MNVGEVLASELKALTGIEAVASDLTYDLRSGEPDMLDSMVASTFANVAMDLIRDGIGGRMVAIRDGKYSHVSLAETGQAAAPRPARRLRHGALPPEVRGPLGDPAPADPVAGACRRAEPPPGDRPRPREPRTGRLRAARSASPGS